LPVRLITGARRVVAAKGFADGTPGSRRAYLVKGGNGNKNSLKLGKTVTPSVIAEKSFRYAKGHPNPGDT